MRTGSFFPQDIKETLRNPVVVMECTPSGFRLQTGDVIPIPGFPNVPCDSPAITFTTQDGIEIDEQHNVYGLVHVCHNKCGNDPVRTHT